MKVVGNCPHCGAPIYQAEDTGTAVNVPPQIHYTCLCRFNAVPHYAPYYVPHYIPGPSCPTTIPWEPMNVCIFETTTNVTA